MIIHKDDYIFFAVNHFVFLIRHALGRHIQGSYYWKLSGSVIYRLNLWIL